jgi:hypothetical protein
LEISDGATRAAISKKGMRAVKRMVDLEGGEEKDYGKYRVNIMSVKGS